MFSRWWCRKKDVSRYFGYSSRFLRSGLLNIPSCVEAKMHSLKVDLLTLSLFYRYYTSGASSTNSHSKYKQRLETFIKMGLAGTRILPLGADR